jgi:hypothetical protein
LSDCVQVQIRVDPCLLRRKRLAFDRAAPCTRVVLKQWPARDAVGHGGGPTPLSLFGSQRKRARTPGLTILLGGFGMSSCRVCGSSAFKDQRRIAGSSTLWLFLSPRSHTHSLAGCSGRILYFNNSADMSLGLNSRAYVQRTLNKSRQ